MRARPQPRYPGRRRRLACILIVVCIVVFLASAVLAAWRYPGGHPWNPQAEGYRFWRNTMSDLGKAAGNSGQPAGWAADVFNASMALLAVAFVAIWTLVSFLLERRPRLARFTLGLGVVSVAGMAAVAATPADRVPLLHTLAIALAAIPALAATILAAAGFLRLPGRRWLGLATLVLLAIALLHFGQYVRHFWLGGPWTRACPAVQKIAVVATLLWMLAIVFAARPRHAR